MSETSKQTHSEAKHSTPELSQCEIEIERMQHACMSVHAQRTCLAIADIRSVGRSAHSERKCERRDRCGQTKLILPGIQTTNCKHRVSAPLTGIASTARYASLGCQTTDAQVNRRPSLQRRGRSEMRGAPRETATDRAHEQQASERPSTQQQSALASRTRYADAGAGMDSSGACASTRSRNNQTRHDNDNNNNKTARVQGAAHLASRNEICERI